MKECFKIINRMDLSKTLATNQALYMWIDPSKLYFKDITSKDI